MAVGGGGGGGVGGGGASGHHSGFGVFFLSTERTAVDIQGHKGGACTHRASPFIRAYFIIE